VKEAHHKANHLFMKQFNLSIPTPCHERWEQMTPTEQGRFCSSCQKTVIDFTHMTDQQLAAFFKKPVGNVCGRLAKDQLERDITITPKRIPWLRYFFQFTLPAFLLSLKAAGQKIERVESVSVIRALGDTLKNKIHQDVSPDKLICGAVPDDLALSTSLQGALGGVIVVHKTKRPKKAIPLLNTQCDTAFNQFSVYPNPARSNGALTIDCKKMAKGTYTLQLVTVSGSTVLSKQLELDQKGGLLRTDLPAISPGQYVLTLTHNVSNKLYSEKIQVL